MATHSSVLAWRIPGIGEPGGLPSVGLDRVGHDWSDLAATLVLPTSQKDFDLKTSKTCSVTQSCPTLCDLLDCSLSGSSVCGILQARILEWVAISFSRGSSRPRNRTLVSCIAGRWFTNWVMREARNVCITICKIDDQWKFHAWSRALKAGALGQPRGMGWGGRLEGGSGRGTHVHLWVTHVGIWQEPLQHCEVIILQFK